MKNHAKIFGKWVSVSKKLPDVAGAYLAFMDNCKICMVFFSSQKEWVEMWSQKQLKVKYWMPLPPAPVAAEGELNE